MEAGNGVSSIMQTLQVEMEGGFVGACMRFTRNKMMHFDFTTQRNNTCFS
jgi:hypothetical protein